VFLINSRLAIVSCDHVRVNERGRTSPEVTSSLFAEFLKPLSLAHLGLLDLPTCVGLRYGLPWSSLRNFSRKLNGSKSSCSHRTLYNCSINHSRGFSIVNYFTAYTLIRYKSSDRPIQSFPSYLARCARESRNVIVLFMNQIPKKT
jgi:hypothetical protein